jgi:2-dehydro-3-deoxygalactonokinase
MTHSIDTSATPAYCVALDWGTSSLRAYLLNCEGQVLDHQASALGILAPQVFKDTVNALCAQWDSRYGTLPCIASGMIGSQQGWQDAGYLPTPASFQTLAKNAVDIASMAGRPFWIVPGVKQESATALDVMRGEETQVFGAGIHDGMAVLPGTHSKWVTVKGGEITDFQTYMTGEVFALMKTHSILSKFMPALTLDAVQPAFDATSFSLGLKQTLTSPGELLARLFSSRTMGLFQKLSASQQPDYLSGMLIGAEVGAALKTYQPTHITLLGDAGLVQRYQEALRVCAVVVEVPLLGVPVAAIGLHRVATQLI